MIRINLSPEAISNFDPRHVAAEIALGAAVVAVFFFAPGLYAASLTEESDLLRQETAQKQVALGQLKADNMKINEFKLAISDLKARTNKIKNLNRGRKQPVFALDQLQQQHPDQLWLESIKLAEKKIEINGVSAEPELIADYVARIRALNNSGTEAQTDIESFVPPFNDFLPQIDEIEAEEAAVKELNKETVLPLSFSDITIVSSDLDTVGGSDVYRFLIEFGVNLPEGI